jgi:hypothetical protein
MLDTGTLHSFAFEHNGLAGYVEDISQLITLTNLDEKRRY